MKRSVIRGWIRCPPDSASCAGWAGFICPPSFYDAPACRIATAWNYSRVDKGRRPYPPPCCQTVDKTRNAYPPIRRDNPLVETLRFFHPTLLPVKQQNLFVA